MPTSKRIVAIIGSSKFKDQHMGVAQKLTLQNKIVLIAGFFHHVDRFPITDTKKLELDSLMLEKVKLADEVFVVNFNGYIGQSTKLAIALAKDLGKHIDYLEKLEPG